MNLEPTTTEVTSILVGTTLTTVTTTITILPPTLMGAPTCVVDSAIPMATVSVEPSTVEATLNSPLATVKESTGVALADTEVAPTIPVEKEKRLTAVMREELHEKFGWPFFQEVESKNPTTLEELDALVTTFKEEYTQPYQAKGNVRANVFIDKIIKRNIDQLRRDILQAQKDALKQVQKQKRLAEKRKRMLKKQKRLAALKSKALANPRKVTEKNPTLRAKLQHELETLKKNVEVLGKSLQHGIGDEDHLYAKILTYIDKVKVIEYRLS
jgi:hypothetical protein